MSFISRVCYVIGSLLLLNAGYASYTFNQVAKRVLDHNLELPLDIKIEALVACVIVALGAILSIEASDQVDIYSGALVKPRDQSGLKNIFMGEATGEHEIIGTTPFDHIESNVEFINIIKRREEFAKWEQSIHS
ncbi:hypothetical protein PP7435_CHR3-0664 [Komagataella phaffii CBS 7435]|uniref:Uncharacterized protein n=2 Tax=Komagataella phaffii TaxID=460519 RepID=C4R4V4_KOMPG|nr:Hypothetical protein PAS_chr3_0541 [Komagataella phaffii GS115]AOA63528.1 GQ67_03614T0 [Komagataella phaffii]CAH2449647.1 hypothetical protein BQ9382_C3-3535 [Komagataella phaffii CBS 7435]AOA68291.1 GQ68_03585T0 [Komagataella phaffii GS115]CAY70590.1 Hypothetical protein PAS_chr3_0541 [Komagataella phaffii GS115]CCA39621.1 hypothetical protein PP7435_CHR3-0664 [Komagataella phaffii CBS 7435]